MLDTLTNSIGMTLNLLPAGVFTMGGDWDAEQADENELPKHETITPVNFLAKIIQLSRFRMKMRPCLSNG